MLNTHDLKIKEEVLPLFNATINPHSKERLHTLLETPLKSVEEILARQNILKGFQKNKVIFKNYSYSAIYLNEAFSLLNDGELEDYSQKQIKYKLLVANNEKAILRSRVSQLILLFHRLQTHYFSQIDLEPFPTIYRQEIKQIEAYISNFELIDYEHAIREHTLKDKHVIEIVSTIIRLKNTGLTADFWDKLYLFEAYLSISKSIDKYQFTFPNFTSKGIKLEGLYHPLLKQAVKNDFETHNNVILLNGPNMSGKSTFLKAISLCVYLGHIGLAIPAAFGEIPFCNGFSIQINRKDDMLKGYSHFMYEVKNLKDLVESIMEGKKCFAIFDELFNGTNVEDALEICKTTIQGLSGINNSYVFISSHIQELKTVSNADVSKYYIDCELDDGQPKFTYKIQEGWSNIKVGRILFEKEGLNKMLEQVRD